MKYIFYIKDFSYFYFTINLVLHKQAFRNQSLGNSLAVQWLGLHALTAEGTDSVPGWGTKIPQAAVQPKEKKKESITH